MPSAQERNVGIVLRLGLLALFVWLVKGILVPVALGALFALLLHPVQVRVEKRLGAKRKHHAAMIVTVSAIVLGLVPLSFVVQQAIRSANAFLQSDYATTMGKIQHFLVDKLGGYQKSLGNSFDLKSGVEQVVGQLGSAVGGIAGGIAAAVPQTIVSGFLFLVSLYYFSRDGDALTDFLLRMSPFTRDETRELFGSVRETVNGAILGLIATAAVQGGLTLIALYAFGIPGAFIFGIIAALLSFIPMVGTTPVTIGAVVYLLASGRPAAAAGMGVLTVVIGLSDNVIRPWVQSSQTHMHPLVALLGIFGGLEILGASGIFLGPVIAAAAIWTVDTATALRNHQKERATVSLAPPPPSMGQASLVPGRASLRPISSEAPTLARESLEGIAAAAAALDVARGPTTEASAIEPEASPVVAPLAPSETTLVSEVPPPPPAPRVTDVRLPGASDEATESHGPRTLSSSTRPPPDERG